MIDFSRIERGMVTTSFCEGFPRTADLRLEISVSRSRGYEPKMMAPKGLGCMGKKRSEETT